MKNKSLPFGVYQSSFRLSTYTKRFDVYSLGIRKVGITESGFYAPMSALLF